jgi:uncharacterized protein YjiK
MHGSVRGLLLAVAIGACGAPAPGVGAAREASRTASVFADAPAATLALPSALKEVSGLAVTADGRVFAHDDERAVVRQIDLASGAVVKNFAVGSELGDFEGLAIVGADFFLIASNGRLLRFREGADGARVPFTAFDVGLASVCEIEGLGYDKTSDSLIVPCKQMQDPARRGTVALYAWSVRAQQRGDRPWRSWSMATLAAAAQVDEFHPATVEIDARSGRLILVAGRESALVELAPDGAILAGRRLGPRHFQPEGAAILPDGSLLIADEARKKGSAFLTRYAHRP